MVVVLRNSSHTAAGSGTNTGGQIRAAATSCQTTSRNSTAPIRSPAARTSPPDSRRRGAGTAPGSRDALGSADALGSPDPLGSADGLGSADASGLAGCVAAPGSADALGSAGAAAVRGSVARPCWAAARGSVAAWGSLAPPGSVRWSGAGETPMSGGVVAGEGVGGGGPEAGVWGMVFRVWGYIGTYPAIQEGSRVPLMQRSSGR
ncbi:hypothetical protein GCM10023259_076300 [Thermocatellispora tengchongensis]